MCSSDLAQPVIEIVAHMVATEGQHRERIATYHALLAEGGSRGFGAEGRGHVDPEVPVEGFVNQRYGGGPAAAEDEGRDGYAGRVLPVRVDGGALVGRRGEAGVGMGRLAAGFAVRRCPVLALPVDAVGRGFLGHAFPPDVAVIGEGDIGEDDVLLQGRHGVEVGLLAERPAFRQACPSWTPCFQQHPSA